MAIKPSVTITVPGGKATLKEGTDYTVSYEKAATNVGETGKIVITYNKDNKNINAKDSAQTVEYGVTAKDLKDVTVAADRKPGSNRRADQTGSYCNERFCKTDRRQRL